jgi:hypothetical protein
LEAAAEIQEKVKGSDALDPKLYSTLAVVYHQFKKNKLAEGKGYETRQD